MKTLKDVYIKVTENNADEIKKYIKINKEHIGLNISFSFDDVKSWNSFGIYNKQKVSLSELKRLIDTIPTREEITRLKRQISAYKTNYDRAVKHSLSKEEIIEDLQNNNSELIQKLVKANRDIKSKSNEIHKLKNDIKKVRSERDWLDSCFKKANEMYDNALKENEDLNKEIDIWRLDYSMLYEEYKQLKQRKWWQIWK